VKVLIPATRDPAPSWRSVKPRWMPISSPQARAVATESASQFQLPFS
jgi:hypothetical protein